MRPWSKLFGSAPSGSSAKVTVCAATAVGKARAAETSATNFAILLMTQCLLSLFFRRLPMPELKQQQHVVKNLQAAADDERPCPERGGEQRTGQGGAYGGCQAARHGREACGGGALGRRH